MTIKFEDLNPIPELQDDDLIVAHDTSEGTTGQSTVSALKNKLITTDIFQQSVEDIIDALNDYPLNGNDTFDLSASKLRLSEDDKRFFHGEYYLNWDNTTNKPIIPLDIIDMTNAPYSADTGNGGYVVVENDNLTIKERTRGVDGSGLPTIETIVGQKYALTTDFLQEGLNNRYFSEERVDERVKAIFPEEFNKLSPRFDKAFAVDSLTETVGEFIEGESPGESNKISVSDPSGTIINSYRVGDALRIYGAGQYTNSRLDNPPLADSFALTINGFPSNDTGSATPPNGAQAGTGVTFRYQVATFSFGTGEISPAVSDPSRMSRDVYISSEVYDNFGAGTEVTVYDLFNAENFITLDFSNIPTDQGLLVYRSTGRVGESLSESRLIYVIGPKEKERGSFIDYYNFDNGIWSEKRYVDNAFLVNGEYRETDQLDTEVIQDGLMHFPINPPSISRRGWVDTTVKQVARSINGFVITLSDTFTYNATGTDIKKCWISHNDTLLIQNAITQAGAGAIKSINLNAKQYVIDSLSIPNEFGLVGVPYITKLKKMPWSGSLTTNGQSSINQMIRVTDSRAKAISISGIDIDGTSNLQFLMSEPSDNPIANYIVNLGFQSTGCLFDKVRIDRPVGGGVYARSPFDLKITGSELTNSGNSDRYPYSPLLADGGNNTVITANRFNNFTDYIDVSVTDQGIVSGNIIANIGSGIFTYGSKFLITNPNALVGPAGEFLPSPDILNSEYDAVNIELQDAFMAENEFIGPALTYQENGDLFNLGSGKLVSELRYQAFMIRKEDDGSESNWTFGSETIANPDGSGSPHPTIDFSKQANQDRDLGQFGFNISSDSVKKIKGTYQGSGTDGIYSYAELKKRIKTALLDEELNHVGLGWLASYTHSVEVGVINSVKSWNTTDTVWENVDAGVTVVNANGTADEYRINVTITEPALAVFSTSTRIKLSSDHGAAINGSNAPEYGTIDGDPISLSDGTLDITLKYSGATSITSGGSTGKLNIVNSFTLAQGRII